MLEKASPFLHFQINQHSSNKKKVLARYAGCIHLKRYTNANDLCKGHYVNLILACAKPAMYG